ncbi:MAG: hypothetical protein E6Q77_01765 [Rhizobium sp.]|nr:MAG: hypothetical protein E6Q77_01765 [Rhizobium sp.]
MPSTDAQLVVSLEARLNKFEKQLKEAGIIADRQVKAIEDRFARSNPAFSGSFLGNFLGNLSTKALDKALATVDELLHRFSDLDKTARLVGDSMNNIFGIQEAAGKFGASVADVNQSVRGLATLLDQMQRGEENSLSKLFDVNPQALRGVNRDALDLQGAFRIVADIVQNARTEIQKIDLAKAAGQAEAMVPFLEKGGAAVGELQKNAAAAAPDLQKLADSAKAFDDAWQKAVTNVKAYLADNFRDAIKQDLQDLSALLDLAGRFLDLFKGGLIEKQAAGAAASIRDLKSSVDAIAARPDAPTRVTVDTTNLDRQGGTSTRDRSRGLSNVPTAAKDAGSDRFSTVADNIEKRVASLRAEAEAMNLGTEARERARITAELETIAKQQNGKVTDEQRQRIEELATAYGKAAEKIEQARSPLATFARESADLNKQLNQFAASSLDNLTGSLADVISGTQTAAEAFKNFANQVINDLLRIAIRASITGPLAALLFGGGTGAGSLLSLFGGARAEGGPVSAGTPYLVGERGPELIVPKAAGTVVPNSVLSKGSSSGGVSVVIQQTNSYAAGMQPGDIAMVDALVKKNNPVVIAATVEAVRKGTKNDSRFLG